MEIAGLAEEQLLLKNDFTPWSSFVVVVVVVLVVLLLLVFVKNYVEDRG
jgi:hypothetical protein